MTQLASLSTTISAESAAFLRGIEDCRGGLKRLISSLDPAAAATARFNSNMTVLNNGLRTGKIDQETYAASVARLTRQLEVARGAQGGVTTSAGQMRSGMQQLSFQLNDIATGFATGQRPMMIFAQQSSQVIQSLQLMSGQAKGFLGMLAGPWGMALTAAATVAAPLISNIFGIGEAADSAKPAVDRLTGSIDALSAARGRYSARLVGDASQQLAISKGELKILDQQIAEADAKAKPYRDAVRYGGSPTAALKAPDIVKVGDIVVDGAVIKETSLRQALEKRLDLNRRILQSESAINEANSGKRFIDNYEAAGKAREKFVRDGAAVSTKFKEIETPDSLRGAASDSSAAAYQANTSLRELMNAQSNILSGENSGPVVVPDLTEISKQLEAFTDKNKLSAQTVTTAWTESAQQVVGSIQSMASAFGSGDFLNILQSGLNILSLFSGGGALSGIGKFFGGFLAEGGPAMAGVPYVVGERGPELFIPSTSGRVVSNDNLKSRSKGGGLGVPVVNDNLGGMLAGQERIIRIAVDVEASPYFDARVRSQASDVAAPMAASAVGAGASLGVERVVRRNRNRVPGRNG